MYMYRIKQKCMEVIANISYMLSYKPYNITKLLNFLSISCIYCMILNNWNINKSVKHCKLFIIFLALFDILQIDQIFKLTTRNWFCWINIFFFEPCYSETTHSGSTFSWCIINRYLKNVYYSLLLISHIVTTYLFVMTDEWWQTFAQRSPFLRRFIKRQ